jgi:hypothetical protein
MYIFAKFLAVHIFLENRARKNIKEFVREGDGRLVDLVGLSCNTIENEAQHASK